MLEITNDTGLSIARVRALLKRGWEPDAWKLSNCPVFINLDQLQETALRSERLALLDGWGVLTTKRRKGFTDWPLTGAERLHQDKEPSFIVAQPSRKPPLDTIYIPEMYEQHRDEQTAHTNRLNRIEAEHKKAKASLYKAAQALAELPAGTRVDQPHGIPAPLGLQARKQQRQRPNPAFSHR